MKIINKKYINFLYDHFYYFCTRIKKSKKRGFDNLFNRI